MRSIRRKDIGDTSSGNNFLSFLEDTLSKLKNKVVSLIRLDSGFFQSEKDGHGLADSGTIQKSSSTLLFPLMRNLG